VGERDVRLDVQPTVAHLLERFGFDVVDLAARVDAVFCAFAAESVCFGL
jgi:hypothetical protein